MSEENIVDVPEVTEDATPVAEVSAAEPIVEEALAPAIEEEVEGKTVGVIESGAIGSTVTKTKKPKAEQPKPTPVSVDDKVAIHSTKNVSWQEVGKVSVGINIVTKDEADKWLKRNHVRLATPEEVAKEYNV